MPQIRIGKWLIGDDAPVFVVAEISANHNQSLGKAIELIRAARRAGANAVKLQTYTADSMTIDSDLPLFQIQSGPWARKSLYQLYGEAATPYEWIPKLQEVALREGVILFSAPFDPAAVDWLEKCNVPLYKVASGEIVDIPLLTRIAQTGKPVFVSCGMATEAEIGEAIDTLHKFGSGQPVLLKCTSAYPAPPDEMNLFTIPDMINHFGLTVGLSDHTLGSQAAITAVALGAQVIEKHFILSRLDGGPDASFSMEPYEFTQMVADIRTVEKMLGQVSYTRTRGELKNNFMRRSLFVVQDVKQGELFTADNVRSIRPGFGLHTRYLPRVLGSTAKRDIPRGTPLEWDMFA